MTCSAISKRQESIPLMHDVGPCVSPALSPEPTDKVSEVASKALQSSASDISSQSSPSKLSVERPQEKSVEAAVEKKVESKDQPPALPQKTEQISVPSKIAAKEDKPVFEKRVSNLFQKFVQWRKDYDPAPAFYIYMIPMYGGIMGQIVKEECKQGVSDFIEDVQNVKNEGELAALLINNRTIMENNMWAMNTATVTKMEEAITMIEEEMKTLGDVPLPVKEDPVSEDFRERIQKALVKYTASLSQDDPLLEEKKRLARKIHAWVKDFKPQPTVMLSSVFTSDKISIKTESIFQSFIKNLVRAQTRDKYAKIVRGNRSLLELYTQVVDTPTEKKLKSVCVLLENAEKSVTEQKGAVG